MTDIPGQMALRAIVKTLQKACPDATAEQLGEQVAHALQEAFHGSTPPWMAFGRDRLKSRLEELTGAEWTWRVEWEEWPFGPRLEAELPGAPVVQTIVSMGWSQQLLVLARLSATSDWTLHRKWDTAYETERLGREGTALVGDPFEVALKVNEMLLVSAFEDLGVELSGRSDVGE